MAMRTRKEKKEITKKRRTGNTTAPKECDIIQDNSKSKKKNKRIEAQVNSDENDDAKEKVRKKKKQNINSQKITGHIIALVENEEASIIDPIDFDTMTKDIVNKTNHKNTIQHMQTQNNSNGNRLKKRKHLTNRHYHDFLHIPIQILAILSWLIIPNTTDDKYRTRSLDYSNNEPIGITAGRIAIIPKEFNQKLEDIGCRNSKQIVNVIRQRIIDAAAYVIVKQPRKVKKI